METMISYSHRDYAALDRLHVHLAVLLQEGLIEEWFDRKILPGDEIDAEIDEKLESYDLFLLLVSPDFLASDYCVNREMRRTLERHGSGEARVVPIIVEPCDWQATPLSELKVLPQDGKPVSDWRNENSAYLNVVQELRRILKSEDVPQTIKVKETVVHKTALSVGTSRYRVNRDFDEFDRSVFRAQAFGIIRDYFNDAISAIETSAELTGHFVSISDASFTCAVVNKMRENGTAHITVHMGRDRLSFGDISYVYAENESPTSANGMFTIEADEYELYLSAWIDFEGDRMRVTPSEAAERLWVRFLDKAEISIA